MPRIFRQTYTTINKKTDKRELRTARKWYYEFKAHDGKIVKRAGYRDRAATMTKAVEEEKKHERIHAGLLPVEVLDEVKSLAEWLPVFLDSLRASQTSPDHVRLRELHLTRIHDGCGFVFPNEIDGERVRLKLAEWMRREVKPMSAQTANHYLASAQHFCEYLRSRKALVANPIEGVERWNTKLNRKRLRRVIGDDEFARLLNVARLGEEMNGIGGPARAVLYLVAAYSGYRASELQSLKVGQVIRGDRVCLPIAASQAKNRQDDTIPLPDWVGKELLGLVASRKADEQIWPGRWAKNRTAGKMLQRDLAAAGIPYKDGGKFFDFHALRYLYATNLLRAGVPLAQAQRLMRQSRPELTMDVYAQLDLADLAKEVSKLDRKTG